MADAYIVVTREPDDADSLCLQGAFQTNESDDGTGGSGRLNNNQLAIVATHRGADADTLARACIDDANVLPCLSIKDTTTTHPQLTSLRRILGPRPDVYEVRLWRSDAAARARPWT